MKQTCVGCGKEFDNSSTLSVDQDVCDSCYNAVLDHYLPPPNSSQLPLTPAQEEACNRAETRMPS